MKYFTSQEDTLYLHWQIETYLSNFERTGIDLTDVNVILLFHERPSRKAVELQQKYNANFHFFEKPREINRYVASAKPYGMWKLWKEVPELSKERIFYHDADIIFTSLPTFPDKGSWMSECKQLGGPSYIDFEYLNQFDGVVKGLEEIVGVKARSDGGGAQYIIEGATAEYWEKVYLDSFKIFDFMNKWNSQRPPGERDVQAWCAEMWATLWNLWKFGIDVNYHSSLDFCASRDPIDKLKPIVHNAGLMNIDNFDKNKYRDRYPPLDLAVNPNWCNYVYYEEVKKNNYIRDNIKFFDMIKIVKEGSQFKVGEKVNLGKDRNLNAVNSGFAVWVDSTDFDNVEGEKKEGTPKKITTSARGKKIQTKNK